VIRHFNKIIALAGVAALAATGVAEAKTYKVNFYSTKGTTKGTQISGSFKGTPFGACKMKGKLLIPKAYLTFTCKGGTFKMTEVGKCGAANDSCGTWTAHPGTGKFKGIKGKGTFTGKLSTGAFRYKGTVKY
jgi:hypothetical protein